MKIRIYAISLLLSFLATLSHEMIPHDHHDDLALSSLPVCQQNGAHEHKHLPNDGHQNEGEEEKEKEQNHSFPFHQHLSPTAFICNKKLNLVELNQQIIPTSMFPNIELFRIEFSNSHLQLKCYRHPPALVSKICNIKANVLRGPPAIV